MALTTSSALKTFIEAQGLGVSAYRDFAPTTAAKPYVVVHEALGIQPETLHGPDCATVGVELAQVDVFYGVRDPVSGSKTDGPSTVASLIRLLQGASLPDYGSPAVGVYACLVRNVVRQVELQNDLIHYSLTLHIWREL